jgi:hypothetical protein
MESRHGGVAANLISLAREANLLLDLSVGPGGAEVNEPNRLLGRAAIRTGDARHTDGDVDG